MTLDDYELTPSRRVSLSERKAPVASPAASSPALASASSPLSAPVIALASRGGFVDGVGPPSGGSSRRSEGQSPEQEEGAAAGATQAADTASASALPQLADDLDVPVWGVIDPGVEAARRVTRSGHVAVIGTKGTIASGVYQSKLKALGLKVWAQACPMFVHLVEEGLE